MKRSNIIQTGLLLSWLLFAISCAEEFKTVPSTSGSTITETISSNTDFNIFTAVLSKTGLAATFNNNNSGVFTVFAPIDAAFNSYFNSLGGAFATLDEAGVLNWINNTLSTSTTPSIATLSGISLYHAVSSEVASAKITGAQGFVTIGGTARLSASKVGSAIWLNANRAGNSAANGGKSVILDIDASNGIIHSIDKVLIPVTTANIWASTLLSFSVNYGVSPPAVTVYGTVLKRPTSGSPINLSDATALAPTDAVGTNYNLLSMAIARAELATIIIPITTPFPDYTVFAPTDAAFLSYLTSISAAVTNEATARDFLNTLSPTALADLVNYHVVKGRVVTTDLSDGLSVPTALTGKSFTTKITGSTITITDGKGNTTSTVTIADNLTNAGVLHQINKVLISN